MKTKNFFGGIFEYTEDKQSVKEYAVAAAMIVALVIMCGIAEAVIR